MRYVIRQRIFSIGDKFTIKDEAGEDIYVVQGQWLSIGKKLRIYDMGGNELCYIEQQVFRLMPEYFIFVGGQHVVTVKKKFRMFRHDFDITGSAGQYQVTGDFLAHEFEIMKDGRSVARISKEFFSFADTYGVEIEDGQDQVTNLAVAIVIDMVCHENNNT